MDEFMKEMTIHFPKLLIQFEVYITVHCQPCGSRSWLRWPMCFLRTSPPTTLSNTWTSIETSTPLSTMTFKVCVFHPGPSQCCVFDASFFGVITRHGGRRPFRFHQRGETFFCRLGPTSQGTEDPLLRSWFCWRWRSKATIEFLQARGSI